MVTILVVATLIVLSVIAYKIYVAQKEQTKTTSIIDEKPAIKSSAIPDPSGPPPKKKF